MSFLSRPQLGSQGQQSAVRWSAQPTSAESARSKIRSDILTMRNAHNNTGALWDLDHNKILVLYKRLTAGPSPMFILSLTPLANIFSFGHLGCHPPTSPLHPTTNLVPCYNAIYFNVTMLKPYNFCVNWLLLSIQFPFQVSFIQYKKREGFLATHVKYRIQQILRSCL